MMAQSCKKTNHFRWILCFLGISLVFSLVFIFIRHVNIRKPYYVADEYYIIGYNEYNTVYCIDIICLEKPDFEVATSYFEELETNYYNYYNSADAILIRCFSTKASLASGNCDYIATMRP